MSMLLLGAGSGGGVSSLFSYVAGDRPAGSIFRSYLSAGTGPNLINGAPRFGYVDGAASDPDSGNLGWYRVTGATKFIAFLGDSVTVGATATDSYAMQVYRQLTGAWHLGHFGQSSARLSTATAGLDINVYRTTYVTPAFTSLKGIFVVFGGSNDMFLDAATAATALTRLKVITAGLRASHPLARIIVVTTLPRENNAGFETKRQTLRTSLLAGDSSWEDRKSVV